MAQVCQVECGLQVGPCSRLLSLCWGLQAAQGHTHRRLSLAWSQCILLRAWLAGSGASSDLGQVCTMGSLALQFLCAHQGLHRDSFVGSSREVINSVFKLCSILLKASLSSRVSCTGSLLNWCLSCLAHSRWSSAAGRAAAPASSKGPSRCC